MNWIVYYIKNGVLDSREFATWREAQVWAECFEGEIAVLMEVR
jgi:hypothetical protein